MKTIAFTIALAAGLLLPGTVMPAQDAKKEAAKKSTKVIDPVCGMEVDSKTAEKSAYKGKSYYFCARSEKEAFEKNPEKYLARGKK